MATNAFDQANLAFAQANSAYTQANAAFDKANTVSSSSGTFTVGDDLVVTNNVSVGGYIVPVEIGQNLGNVDYRWYNLYMDGGIYADGSFGNPGQILSSSDYGTLKWIDAPSGGGGGGGGTVDSYARATANIASSTAQAAFNKANTASAASTDAYARNTANTAYNNTIVLQAVNVTQNTRITTAQTTAQAAFDKANTVSAGSGATGATGVAGATGVRGASGAAGSNGSQGASGVAGASGIGTAGADGATGPAGIDGASGVSGATGPTGATGVGTAGATGSAGADGASGVSGASGVAGASGAVGASGAGGSSNLVFGASGSVRTLTGFTENGTTSTVRTAAISGGVLSLTLASFTPTVSAVALASSSLNWDVACTGFTATADNPTDVVDQYISSVASIAQVSGSIATTLSNYSAGSYTNTPAGGVDWSISYTPNNSTSYIRSTSTTITGGSASGTITFNYYNGSSFTTWGTTASFSVTWATPTHSISLSSLSGSTFLQTYTSVGYTVSGTGITTSSNRVYAVTATGGTVSSSTGSGTFTFTTPIHKDNTGTTRTTTLSTTLTRPVAVTGTSYSVTLGPTSTSNPSASFTYPSYWLWSTSVATVPTRADIINGTGVEAGVTVLGDQVHTLTTQAINNTDANPRAFWFAVRASATQPTTFKTGASAGLLSDVSYTDGSTVGLQPDSPPSGYTAENYHLYGFTLQPGITYVSIS